MTHTDPVTSAAGTPTTTRFLILGMQRSGTTVTHVALRGHPEVAMSHEEVYVEPFFTRGLTVFTGGKSSYDERQLHYQRLFDLLAAPERQAGARAIGFKVAIGDSRAAMDVVNCVCEYLRDVKVIFVHRSDLVAQYGSLRRAIQSGEWHLWEGMKARSGQPFHIPLEEFEAYAREAQGVLAQLRRLRETHEVMEFQYEKDIAAGANYQRLFRFLGLTEVPMTWNTVEKVAPPPEHYITNYQELLAAQTRIVPPHDSEARALADARQREQSEQETSTFLGYRAWAKLKRGDSDGACHDLVMAVRKRKETPIDLSLQGYLCGLFATTKDVEQRPEVVAALTSLRGESGHLPCFKVRQSEILFKTGAFSRIHHEMMDLLGRTRMPDGEDRDRAFDLLFHVMTRLADTNLVAAALQVLEPLYADESSYEILKARITRWEGHPDQATAILQRVVERHPNHATARSLQAQWQS